MTVAANAGLVPKRFGHSLTQGNPDVFHGVVLIDMQITAGLDLKVYYAMTGYLVHHVFEEGNASGECRLAGAVQIYRGGNPGFQSIAGNTRLALGHAVLQNL